MKPYIILASQSPRRSMLLNREGYRFEVIPSHAEEHDATHHNVHNIVMENARIKGAEVVKRLQEQNRTFSEETLLIAADTLVVMGEKVYGKPVDFQQAEQFMNELGGHEHQVLTGVFLHRFSDNRQKTFLDVTRVILKVMNHEEIQDLFRRVNPLDKAAAYGYQDAPEIVSSLQGHQSNIIGLPVERLAEEIGNWKV